MTVEALHDTFLSFYEAATRAEFLLAVHRENRWFTPEMVRHALDAVRPWFDSEAWVYILVHYPVAPRELRVGISMAGNVPLVGLHDLLVVLASGHWAVIKPSSKDSLLMLLLLQHLPQAWQARCRVVPQLVPGELNFLLATGSGATARSLAHQFEGTQQLIRANRWSAALLNGAESEADLTALAQDMLLYHGMGCRSVCNVLAPPGYDWQRLITALDTAPIPALADAWQDLIRWEGAIASMHTRPFLRSTRLLLEPRPALAAARPGVAHIVEAPVSDWPALLAPHQATLQCLTGTGALPLGQAQRPGLLDFADGVDTFLLLSGENQEKSW